MVTFFRALISRTRTMMSLVVLIMFGGIVSYSVVPIETEPEVTVPFVSVSVYNAGISPKDAERLLARPMEIELRRLDGVEEFRSSSGEGYANIILEFDPGFDADQAVLDVREAADQARARLPATASDPIVRKASDSDAPIITISVAGDLVPDRVRYRIATKLKDELESIPEVLEARLAGDRDEMLEAVIVPSQLEAYGISHSELVSAVSRNNKLITAGSMNTGRGSFSVKIPGLIESSKDMLSIPVRATPEGIITLGDVVALRRTFKDARSYTRINGEAAVVIEVVNQARTSVVDVVQKVRKRIDSIRGDFPSSVEIALINDTTPFTTDLIATLEGNITTAMFLVLMFIAVVVGLRSGILVAFGIPFSFMFAFILINLMGYTYNFMTMFGMLLGLGMLIDSAIVVVELADRQMEEGKSPRAAYVYAVLRMLLPVLASTGTTLVAFLPLILWPGIIGDYMKFLPITVFAVLIGALIYALLFVPMLGVLVGRRKQAKADSAFGLVGKGQIEELTGLLGRYAQVLTIATDRPLRAIGITIGVLVTVLALYLTLGKGTRFFIDVEPNVTRVNIFAKGNYSVEEVRDIVMDVEERVMDQGYIDSIYTRASSGGGDRVGSLFINLTHRRTRDVDGFEVERIYARALQDIPGVRAEVNSKTMGPTTGKNVRIKMVGDNLDILTKEVRRLRAHMETMEGLTAVTDSTPVGGIEWRMTVDRAEAAMAGADVSSVGTAVQLVTNGILVSKYRPDDVDREVDIRLRYPEEFRGASHLDDLRVNTREGQVPISSFVRREARPRETPIAREDGERVMYVQARTVRGVLPNDMLEEVRAWLATQSFDPSVRVIFRGANEEEEETNQFIIVSFALALMLMGILMVTQFNSFYQALIILSAVLMSTVGVFFGLLVTNQPFSATMSGVSVVALAGIIVNNNIVLVDNFNYLRRRHPDWELQRVIITTGCQRLRPVLLTTITTGFGLLPMAAGVSVDLLRWEMEVGGPVASYWQPLASSLVFGLSFGTILTLIVTPSMLMAPQAFRWYVGREVVRLRRKWRRRLATG